MRVAAVLVGSVQSHDDGAWHSAIAKSPAAGLVQVDEDGLVGDAQADRKHHGGPEKAVCAYPADHYGQWLAELHRSLPPGAFGENLLLEGLGEADVCIGDVFAIGSARLQLSQPRSPCWKPARRWGVPQLTERMRDTGRTGWYLRVLRAGGIAGGDTVELVARPHQGVTVAEVNRVTWHDRDDRAATTAVLECSALSPEWRQRLAARLR